MLKSSVLDKAISTGAAGPLEIDRSRCLRMRLERNKCGRCIAACPNGAVTIADDVIVDDKLCTGCMLCASACPSGSIEAKRLNFHALLRKLGNEPRPVLGCKTIEGVAAHAKTPCLGWLSKEHVIALWAMLPNNVQLNLVHCKDCANGFAADALEENLKLAAEGISSEIADKVLVVRDKDRLNYADPSLDRRGFFKALKDAAMRGAAGLVDGNGDRGGMAYSSKTEPLKRRLLNESLALADQQARNRILSAYYHTVEIDVKCNDCFACVGMCPSGGLKPGKDGSGKRLMFNTSSCFGCGLCAEFCPRKAIVLRNGFAPGMNPFDFRVVEKSPRN